MSGVPDPMIFSSLWASFHRPLSSLQRRGLMGYLKSETWPRIHYQKYVGVMEGGSWFS